MRLVFVEGTRLSLCCKGKPKGKPAILKGPYFETHPYVVDCCGFAGFITIVPSARSKSPHHEGCHGGLSTNGQPQPWFNHVEPGSLNKWAAAQVALLGVAFFSKKHSGNLFRMSCYAPSCPEWNLRKVRVKGLIDEV